MKIILEEGLEHNLKPLSLGDIIEDDEFYIVTKQYNENTGKCDYILWSLQGYVGYNGFHKTLEDLTKSLCEDIRVFRQEEYELKLIKKN